MTIRVGDIVRCLSMSSEDYFPGTAIVRYLGWQGEPGWLQVERADGVLEGCGATYRGMPLWVIQARDVVKVAPRSINDPPRRYGPYVPIPKALP